MMFSFCPSVFADSKESEEEYGIWPVRLFSKQKVVNLQVMVKDENVYAKASDLAEYYGYDFVSNGEDAIVHNKSQIYWGYQVHWIYYKSNDKKVIYSSGNEKKKIAYSYTMPFNAIKNETGFWVPLSYSLLLMDGDNIISSAYLGKARPTALSEIEKVNKNADKYKFDVVNDLGDSKGRLKLCAICTYLYGFRKIDLSYITYSTFETKYVDKLAVSYCTKDLGILNNLFDTTKYIYDALDDSNVIEKAYEAANILNTSDKDTLIEATGKVLQKIKLDRKLSSQNETICKAFVEFNNQNHKKYTKPLKAITNKMERIWERAEDKSTQIEMIGIFLNFILNFTELLSSDETAVNSMVDFCEYMEKNGTKYISKNAQKTVSLYVNNADNKAILLGKSIISTFLNYTDTALDHVLVAIQEGTQVSKISLKELVFKGAGFCNLLGDIVLFFLGRSGVQNAEKSTMIVYSQSLQNEAERWYRDSFRNLQADPDNPEKWREYAESTYTFLRWCYITRALGCEIIQTCIQRVITIHTKEEKELLKKYKAQLEELNKEVCEVEAFYYLLSDKTDTSSTSKITNPLTINNSQAAVSGFGASLIEPTVLFATNKGTSNTDVDPYFGTIPPVEASAKEGYKENDARIIEQIIFDTQPLVGDVVAYNDALYYWKYTENSFVESDLRWNAELNLDYSNRLVCNRNGKETKIFDSNIPNEWDYTYTGFGKIAIANNRIFFILSSQEEDLVCSTDLNGKSFTILGSGSYIMGLSSDNNYLVVEPILTAGEDDQYYHKFPVINTKTNKLFTIKGDNQWEAWMYNGYLYYTKYRESSHTLELYKESPDGKENIKIGAVNTKFATEENDNYTPFIAEARYPIINDESYVYFCYGCNEVGIGNVFMGGRIARAKLDGSLCEVIAGKDSLVGSYFTISENGTLKTFTKCFNHVGHQGNTKYDAHDESVYIVDTVSGKEKKILTEGELKKYSNGVKLLYNFDKQSSFLNVASVDVVGKKVYVRLNTCKPSGETMGWRSNYNVVGGFLLEKDLDSSKVNLIYQY